MYERHLLLSRVNKSEILLGVTATAADRCKGVAVKE